MKRINFILLLAMPLLMIGQEKKAVIRKAHTLSGKVGGVPGTRTLEIRILRQGSGQDSIKLQVEGGHTWTWDQAINGSYIIQPFHDLYTFNPAFRTVAVNGADVGDIDFQGTQK